MVKNSDCKLCGEKFRCNGDSKLFDLQLTLPKKVLIPKKVLKSKQCDDILDYLSDKFGFCINSFALRGDYAINIDWDMTP